MKQSHLLSPGARAPDFSLSATSGQRYRLQDFAAADVLVIAFICNHCPYVKHMLAGLVKYAADYSARGVSLAAISSNDAEQYPQDNLANMGVVAQQSGFGFPYLYDETQAVALAFRAACTPDLFLFNKKRELSYRGQFDASRPGGSLPVTGLDLRLATDAVLAGQAVEKQVPSVGCSIKWKPGNQPDWG